MLFTYCFCTSQEKYDTQYFRSPLDVPLILSGTFGELRSNHFHSGLDIKTQGKEGLPIYAIADGYISRIKVSQFGFGKAIYVTHPNGCTSVYAHLSKYAEPFQTHVKSVQYKNENNYTGDLLFTPDFFKVSKGDVIAYSGDTGSSGGPHLHFEIRDTKTEHVFNPLLFGFEIKDDIKPTLQGIKVYPIDIYSRINNQNKSFQLPFKSTGNSAFITDKITANGSIGFGIQVFDQLNFATNKNGVYSIEMFVNGEKYYAFDTETFSFDESKFINLHIDYEHFIKFKNRYQKLFKHKADELNMYKTLKNDGVLLVENELNYKVEILIKDYAGNTTKLEIPVIGKPANTLFDAIKDTTNYKIEKDKFAKFSLENITVAFPRNTFYEDIHLDLKLENGLVKVHNPTIPLNKNYTLIFDTTNLSEEQKQKVYIADVDNIKYPIYQETRKRDSIVFTTPKTLGNFSLLFDNQPPKIELLYFKNEQWISDFKEIQVKISDVGSGINTFTATIDGEWILMEYNHKKGILTYDFTDKKLVGTKHIFKLVVTDNVGNTNEFSATFYKKE